MPSSVPFHLHAETLWLCAERCIYWEEEQALILSDLHFGKTGHFRKSGIAVPQNVFKEDLQRLFAQIQFYKPGKLFIVGDLFHSYANKEMDLFLKWRNDISAIEILLIKGNHDILAKKFYENAGIKTTDDLLSVKNFCFTHDIGHHCNNGSKNNYTFSGHIHPGIHIHGLARQSLQFACFYFGETYAVLPAFSRFTGFSKIKIKENDKVFAIVNNNIISV